MDRRWMLAPVALVAAASLALVACGGDDDDDTDGGGGTVATATSAAPPADDPTTAPQPDGETAEFSVTAADFSFSAEQDSLPKGAEVDATLTNGGAAPHTLTLYTDAAFTQAVASGDSGRVAGGEIGEFTFTTPADGAALFYRCEVHPGQMQGEVALQ